MRSVSRFVPRFDVLESHISLSDLLSTPATSTWLSSPATTQATVQTMTVPTASVDPSQPLITLAGGVDGTMPTTPGVNMDVYPPALGYGAPGIPQVPVSPQDPSGFAAPAPSIPKLPLDPVPYFPPPYGVPTYVTLSNMPVTNVI